jgi:hypothetical protein
MWKPAFARFRAAILAVPDHLPECAAFNNAAVGGRTENIGALLKAAIQEVEHGISRAKQGRPLGDADHDI